VKKIRPESLKSLKRCFLASSGPPKRKTPSEASEAFGCLRIRTFEAQARALYDHGASIADVAMRRVARGLRALPAMTQARNAISRNFISLPRGRVSVAGQKARAAQQALPGARRMEPRGCR
jgi:hypothetical protein